MTFTVIAFIGTQRHTDALLILVGIVFQRILVASITDAIIIEGAHGIDGVVGIIILIGIVGNLHISIRLQTYDKDDMSVFFTLLDYPGVFVGTHIEVPVAISFSICCQHTELCTYSKICGLFKSQLNDGHLVAGREVFHNVVIADATVNQELVIAIGTSYLKAQTRLWTNR